MSPFSIFVGVVLIHFTIAYLSLVAIDRDEAVLRERLFRRGGLDKQRGLSLLDDPQNRERQGSLLPWVIPVIGVVVGLWQWKVWKDTITKRCNLNQPVAGDDL